MLNNFIYAKQKSLFTAQLEAGNVLHEAIVFIEDTKEIWTHGTYFDGSLVDLTNIQASIANILSTKQDKITDLDAIRAGANKGATALQSVPAEYITETELSNKGYATTASVTSGLSGKVDKVTGKGLSTNDFTDDDKNRLNNVVEENQNAFSAVKVGTSTISAQSKTDTLNMSGSGAVKVAISNNTITVGASDASTSDKGVVKVGSNISVNSGTISLNKGNVTTALGYVPPQDNTIYEFASGENGFTITPSGGESQKVNVIPKIDNNVIYSDTWSGGKVAVLDTEEGVIKASQYTLGKTVPSTAVFTDTTYSLGNGIIVSNQVISHADTSTLEGSYGPTANVTGNEGKTIVVPQITVDGYGHVTGVTNRTYTSKNTTYSGLTESVLNTGTEETNKLISAKLLNTFVKAQIDSKIAAADAMIYKGTIGSEGTVTALPNTTAKTGWTYKVIGTGTYAGQVCEPGDMIICLTDGSASQDATWNVIQTNSPSHVTGPGSVTSDTVAVFDGTSGKAIKSSTLTIKTSVPENAVFTDNKVTSVDNHYSPTKDDSKQLVAGNATAVDIANSSSGVQVVTGLQRDAAGHVVGVISGAIKATNNTYSTLPNPQSITYKAGDNTLYSYNGSVAKTLNIKGGTNITVSGDTDGNITIAGPSTLKNPSSIKLLVDGTEKIAYDGSNARSINIKPGNNITVSGDTSGNVTISGTPDTKVTSAANHYTPETDSASALSVDASSSTAATWNGTSLVTGVNLTRDSKGHVTGLSVDSIKMPANPNSNTTYTFANGTNGFTVTPSNGTAQTVTVTPSITNNVIYDGTLTSGQVAIFEGTSGKIKASGIVFPNNPKFTDTTYNVVTTTSGDKGLMSADMLTKLNGIAPGAEVNVQSDWNATSGDAFIKNKPDIPTSLTVTQWVEDAGFTKNTGTYSKPSGGIPSSDLSSSVQSSLAKANSALQSESDPVFVASPAYKIKDADITNWNNKTSNTGTVTKVDTGTGLTGSITTSGTINLNLNSTTSLGTIGTTSKLYAVGVDANKKLCVSVPWENNTWRSITDSVSTTNSEISASATAVKAAYDKAVSAYNLANGKTSNTGTVTKITAGTGLNGGDITTSGTISVKYGTESGTACQGNDSRLSDSRNAKDVYSWAKAETKPSYTYSEVGAAPASHTQSYTTLTGSGTTANQAIVSTGESNKWTLKTLGSNAFTNTTIPTNTNLLTNGAGFITSTSSITGNAATATNATNDSAGNKIVDTYATKSELNTGLAGKQNTISNLSTITSNASNGNTAYGWGNHASLNYVKSSDLSIKNILKVSSMPTSPDSNTLYIVI